MSWKAMTDRIQRVARDTFGEEVLYTSYGLMPVHIRAQFQSAHTEVSPETRLPVFTQRPILDIRLGDLQTLPTNQDLVEVGGVPY